mmetsp:Transcript_116547/g.364273  ORF Transcript_116547/g.364273 Transcript_116547/m.364273 type:complete len:384 (-) Transcript_116547:127-1278(-)
MRRPAARPRGPWPLLCALLAGLAAPRPLRPLPGSSARCWAGDFSYGRCCLAADSECWRGPFSREVCCSGLLEALLQAQAEPSSEAPALTWAPQRPELRFQPGAREALPRCMADAAAGGRYESALLAAEAIPRGQGDDLCRNNFVRAAECVAQLADVDVVLDLFLGSGCTAAAMAFGLGLGRGPGNSARRARPPEVFSFEAQHLTLQRALGSDGLVGAGARRGWWRTAVANATDQEGCLELQARLNGPQEPGATSAAGVSATVWAIQGQPYPHPPRHGAQWAYRWNALDVLCQHRAPEVVLIDTSLLLPFESEWMIIETVCRPRWVIIHNLNLQSGSSWVFHRLEILGNWQLEMRGHYVLHDQPWLSLVEVRRVRAWAVFSRRG